MEHATIAAIATPSGRGGIGIIKLSGPRAVAIATLLFQPVANGPETAASGIPASAETDPGRWKSGHLYYGHIVDPDSCRVIDEVLLSAMRAPRSYTREDVVEINAHGGRQVVNIILELVLKHGARLAEPGEFTKRAFLNGRIDLTQAEAVMDVISARTDAFLHMAAAQVHGKMKQTVQSMRKHLIDQLTRTEAAIDFPDDVPETIEPSVAIAGMNARVIQPLQALIRQHDEGRFIRDGLKIAVVGRPNVGKSSLLNCLVQKERAIVTAVPGTTRDTIEETINLGGFPVILVDCAGLHETEDPIERIGARKTAEAIADADLVLFVVEAQRPLDGDDVAIFEHIRHKPAIIVINKIDLVDGPFAGDIPGDWFPENRVSTSALFDRGIEALKKQIIKTAFGKHPIEIDDAIIPTLRQKRLLEDSLQAALAIVRELEGDVAVELMAIHLQEAVDFLGQILGTSVKVDVLEEIFSRFCIGK